jgi:hypothetical protein
MARANAQHVEHQIPTLLNRPKHAELIEKLEIVLRIRCLIDLMKTLYRVFHGCSFLFTDCGLSPRERDETNTLHRGLS